MLSIDEKASFLKNVRFFKDASEHDLEEFAAVFQEAYFKDDEDIFYEGDEGDAIYLIVDGKVRIHSSGREIVTRSRYECIGEMAVIDAAPRSASAMSIGDTMLLRITRDDFYRTAQGKIGIFQNLLKTLAGRLREETENRVASARLMQDITRARELQTCILPPEDFQFTYGDKIVDISALSRPAEKVGGDYYDYVELRENKIGLAIGDVTSHGFHSGLMVFTAKSCLYTQIKHDFSIPGVISVLNNMVHSFVQSGMLMTFCYFIIDLESQTMSFCNAGHPPPYHYRARSKQLIALKDDIYKNTQIMGIDENIDCEIHQFKWDYGDTLILYTDGITEEQYEGEYFGDERFEQLLKENSQLPPHELKNAVMKRLHDYSRKETFTDDVTMLIANIREA